MKNENHSGDRRQVSGWATQQTEGREDCAARAVCTSRECSAFAWQTGSHSSNCTFVQWIQLISRYFKKTVKSPAAILKTHWQISTNRFLKQSPADSKLRDYVQFVSQRSDLPSACGACTQHQGSGNQTRTDTVQERSSERSFTICRDARGNTGTTPAHWHRDQHHRATFDVFPHPGIDHVWKPTPTSQIRVRLRHRTCNSEDSERTRRTAWVRPVGDPGRQPASPLNWKQ